jgi:AAA family ATP:ADP antiporter
MTDEQQRTILFARINFWSQSGSLLLQAVAAPLLMYFAGVGAALLIPCGVLLGLFVWLSLEASLDTLVVGQVAQQIMGYGLLVPAQHVLFTVVSREDKYKTKAFVDTVVFRGSDVAAGKLCQWMSGTGVVLSMLALWMVPAMVLWAVLAGLLGLAYRRRAA